MGRTPRPTTSRAKPLPGHVVCLAAPEPFFAIGQFFRSFPQVSDEEVVHLLAEITSDA